MPKISHSEESVPHNLDFYHWLALTTSWRSMFGLLVNSPRRTLNAATSSFSALADTQAAILKCATSHSEAQISRQWSAITALSSAQNPADAARIHAAVGPETLQTFAKAAAEILQLAANGMEASVRPLRSAVPS